MERFDPEVCVWELLQPMFQDRHGAAVAVLHSQLYVCGGTIRHFRPTSSVERFDPTHNTWERLAPMTCPRGDARAVVIDGRLFICSRDQGDMLSAEWFDPRTGRWQGLLPTSPQEDFEPFLQAVACPHHTVFSDAGSTSEKSTPKRAEAGKFEFELRAQRDLFRGRSHSGERLCPFEFLQSWLDNVWQKLSKPPTWMTWAILDSFLEQTPVQ